MTSDEWRQAAALLEGALAKPPATRRSWVEATAPTQEVCAEVCSLLDARERPGVPVDADMPGEGRTIGAYRLLRRIGQGGMGVVFEAEDTRLRRRVAVKMLLLGAGRGEADRQRLKQEARAAAALAHPSIATIFALEEVDGQVFIVSELLLGETLRAEIARGPLPVPLAIQTALEVARAVGAAHERGIVHRDLKPDNVVRTTTGAVKVLDFGLAKFEPGARDLLTSVGGTDLGAMHGTPHYMPPEQLLGHAVDARTDQFALGVLLYELIEGRTPFGEGSIATTVARVLAGEVQPPGAGSPMPDDVWQIVRRALSYSPANRFASMGELIVALEAAAARLGITPALPVSGSGSQAAEGARTPTPASVIPSLPRQPSKPAEAWWRIHQLAVSAVHAATLWPMWILSRSLGAWGWWVFLAAMAGIILTVSLRLQLWFSSRVMPDELPRQRARLGPWIRAADLALSMILIGTGLAIAGSQAGWGAFLVALGLGLGLVFLVVEPATARAAFRGSASRS